MKKSNTKKRMILRMILIVIISVALGLMLYQLNVQSLTGDQMPMPLGFGMGVVMSGSMEPHLSVDDMIFVVSASEYEVGDWVVFQSKGSLVVHELIAIDGDTVITQGTANNTPDDPMSIDQIKGRVAFHIPGVGQLVDFMKSPIGTSLILVIAAFLLIMSYRSEKKADSDELDAIREEIERLKAEQQTAESDGEAACTEESESKDFTAES